MMVMGDKKILKNLNLSFIKFKHGNSVLRHLSGLKNNENLESLQ